MTSSTEKHLARQEVEELIDRGSPDGGHRDHLLAGCAGCMELFHEVLMGRLGRLDRLTRAYLSAAGDETWRETSVSGALASLGFFGQAEARQAPELLRELLTLPAPARRGRIRSALRFQTVGLVEHLRERAREERFRDPATSLELAELGVEVADALETGGRVPPAVAAEIRALAWASLGNAQRVSSDLFAAERSFRTALALRVVSPERRAELFSLLGSLRIDQARYDLAREVLEEAASLYRGMDDALEAKTLLQLSQAFGESGDPERALPHLERARDLLGSQDQRLGLIIEHYLVQMLLESGRLERAEEHFRALQSHYRANRQDFGIEQRVTWLAARLAAAGGRTLEAEALFREVRQAFADRELGYDYALVNLDLAVLLIEQGRHPEVSDLAREMVPIFASREVHGYALVALALFQQSAAAETATVPFVRRLAAYLRSARRNPYLAFSSSQ